MSLHDALTAAGCTIHGKRVRCAFHGDTNPSASIVTGKDGRPRFKCHVCHEEGESWDEFDVIAQHTGRPLAEVLKSKRAEVSPRKAGDKPKRTFATLPELVATVHDVATVYDYSPSSLHVIRTDNKAFLQAHQQPDGRWSFGGVADPQPLYHGADLGNGPVIVCEGEKDCDALRALGFTATTAPMGADSVQTPVEKDGKPGKADWSALASKAVVIWGDDDEPGYKHADRLARIIARIQPQSIARVQATGAKDAADFIAAHPDDARSAALGVIAAATPVAMPDPLADAAEGQSRLVLRSHADRMRDRWDPPEMLIDGLLPIGCVGAVVAMPGAGKTLIGIEASGCVAGDRPFLGRAVKAGRVIYCCPDSPASTERRMLAIPDDDAASIDTVCDMPPLPGSVPDLRAAIAAASRPGDPVRLLVIDTWDSARTHSGGGWAEQDGGVEDAMRELRKMASDLKVSVLLIHHATRADHGRARGSLVFDAKCEWIAIATGDGRRIALNSTKNRDGEPGPVGTWEISTVDVNGVPSPILIPTLTAPTEPVQPNDKLDTLVSYLASHEGKHTARSLVKTLGIASTGALTRLVDKARGVGWLTADGYALTPSGRQYADDLALDDAGSVPLDRDSDPLGQPTGTAVPPIDDDAGQTAKTTRPSGTRLGTSLHCPTHPPVWNTGDAGRRDGGVE